VSIVSMTYKVYPQESSTRILYIGTDDKGATHPTGPIETVDPLYNPDDHLVEMQGKIEWQLVANEVEAWMQDNEAPVVLVNATKADYADAIRQAYKQAIKEELYRLSYKLYSRYLAGDFTNQHLMDAFDMTGPELNTLKNDKFIPAHDAWIVMQAAVGE